MGKNGKRVKNNKVPKHEERRKKDEFENQSLIYDRRTTKPEEEKKGETKQSTKPNKARKIITIIIEIILVGVMIFSGIKIYFWWQDNNKNKEITDDIAKVVTVETNDNGEEEYIVDFDELKRQNSDTVAWLKVNNTQIEYPIVKTTDNYFYLNHSFDKSINGAGWLFASYDNKFDGTDQNIVIFGHNRTGGPMFGTLKYILNQDWYNNEENRKIIFNTPDEDAIYEVFSIYTVEVEDYYITTKFYTDYDFQYFTYGSVNA